MAELGMSFDPSAIPPRGVFASVVEAALAYHARGYAPVPIPPREKGPKLSDWQKLKATPEQIRRLFRSNSNIGCNLGAISNGLVDIDLDCREAIEFADSFIPATESVFGRASARAAHRLYRVAGYYETRKFVDPILADAHRRATPEEAAKLPKSMIVEFRADGGVQTVFPPSVHPEGEAIEWEDDGDPEPVDGDELAAAVARLAVRVLVARHGEPPHEETPEGWLAALATAPDMARAKAREWLGVEKAGEPQDAPSERPAPTQRVASEGSPGSSADDFFTTVKQMALRSLDAWVPALFPRARPQSGTRAYRIKSKDLGRDLEEDLSIAPNGIVDFGVADMGDARQGKRTAIDLVIEHGGAPDALTAAKWLCERMGVDPESLGAMPDRAEPSEFLDPQPKAKTEAGESIEGELAAKGAPAPSLDPLAGVVFDGDEAAIDPPKMLVKRLVPAEGICFIGGQSGAGKTFVAVDLAVSLASGEPFFGHKIAERVGVVILAAEGSGTIGMRVSVARNEKAFGEILPIAWLGSVPSLSDTKEFHPLVARLHAIGERFRASHGVRLGAIIVDTIAAACDMKDENDNAEASRVIRQLNAIARAIGAVILPVHHYGKGQETGLRGASAWRAGADTVLSVIAERNEITGHVAGRRLALAKSRCDEEGPIAAFELRFVKTGEDEDSEDVGACVVEPSTADPGATETGKASRPSRAATAYLAALKIVLLGERKEKIRPFGSEGSEVAAVDREAVRAEFYRAWPADGDTDAKKTATKRQRFNKGEGELIERKLICTREIDMRTFVWAVTRQANAEP